MCETTEAFVAKHMRYREESGRLVMPVTVRLNHAIADGYLVANVFRLLELEIASFSKP